MKKLALSAIILNALSVLALANGSQGSGSGAGKADFAAPEVSSWAIGAALIALVTFDFFRRTVAARRLAGRS